MPQVKPIDKIRKAAYHFVYITNDLQAIADAFEVSTDAVRKWAKTPEWQEALDFFGYEGNAAFTMPTRDLQREFYAF